MALAPLRRWRTRGPSRRKGVTLPLPPGAGGFVREVLDPTGHPLGGVDVTVTATATQRVTARGTTDPYGLFCTALPAGHYSLLITAESLQPHYEMVDIVAGESVPQISTQMDMARQLELPSPGVWLFDPPHTAIRFIAKHVGMANVHGRFERFEGGIQIHENMEESQVEVRIHTDSINTGNRTRDHHLCSADFLDVENHPYIHFVSSRFVHRGGSKWSLQGTLTMHGVSRSMTLDTNYLGTVNGGYGEELRCAALAEGELHREDYTLNWRNMLARGIAMVGPTVKLELDIQAMYQSHDTPTPPE